MRVQIPAGDVSAGDSIRCPNTGAWRRIAAVELFDGLDGFVRLDYEPEAGTAAFVRGLLCQKTDPVVIESDRFKKSAPPGPREGGCGTDEDRTEPERGTG